MKRIFLLIGMATALVLFNGCAGKSIGQLDSSEGEITLSIFAATSLMDVLMEIQPKYEVYNPGVRLQYNFASSGTLQRQLEQGARADVFLSAGEKQMDALIQQDLVEEPLYIAGNRLVLVVPIVKGVTVDKMNVLLESAFAKISIGNPDSVPAGKYAEEALRSSGIHKSLLPKLVYAKDVRQVLTYVETGNVEAGFVFQSDAVVSDKVKQVMTVSEGFHKPILYPGAVLKSTHHREQAEDFLLFLTSRDARETFGKYGFTNPSNL